MSDDLVTRLRKSTGFKMCEPDEKGMSIIVDTDLMRQAADEIERLRVIIRNISDAVTNEGINPQYHRKVVAKTKTDWPFFWSKIKVVLKEVRGD